MSVTPIGPSDVAGQKQRDLPDAVIDCWNRLIAKNFSGNSATVMQNAAVQALQDATGVEHRQEVFDNGWLDIEPLYIAAGWSVHYDKPAYNETYEASFRFSKK